MTEDQLNKITRSRAKIAGMRFKIEQEEQELFQLLCNCDHLLPEGGSAVLTGPGTDTPTCKICGTNNWAGSLDEHLHRYFGWPIPEPE